MNRKLIDRYITLPMVINVFKQDKDNFNKFKMRNIYHGLLDAAIYKASQDFYELKKDIISRHHLDIKKLDSLNYSVNGEIIKYTADQLKKLSEDIMNEYFVSVEARDEVMSWSLLGD